MIVVIKVNFPGGVKMSVGQYYNMCCKGIGRPVQIRTYDGRTHRGGGFGGGGWGFGWGIALGTIAALAFIPFFF